MKNVLIIWIFPVIQFMNYLQFPTDYLIGLIWLKFESNVSQTACKIYLWKITPQTSHTCFWDWEIGL